MNMDTQSNRREFLKTVAVTGATLALADKSARAQEKTTAGKARLGFDNFSVRAMKWNASQLIDYAASLKLERQWLSMLTR